MLVFFYILNVTLLILHEIESGYEKEWEILKLPGKLTGFLLFHIPIVVILFYGFYFMIISSDLRGFISIAIGVAAFIPFLVHKIIVNKKEHFNKVISNVVIFGNMLFGTGSIIIGILEITGR